MVFSERNKQLSRLVISVARLRGRIQNHFPGSKGLTSKVKYDKTYQVLGAISEETPEDSLNSDTPSDLQSVSSEFEAIVRLILSRDIDRNRVAMQRLMIITAKKPNSPAYSCLTARAIIYGGGDAEEDLRTAMTEFITTSKDTIRPFLESRDENEDGEDPSVAYSIDSAEEDSSLRGKEGGALHAQALRVIANSLEQILSSSDSTDALPIDFSDSFWQQVIDTLCHNVEWCHSTGASGYSMKILRLLHTFEPLQVAQLVRGSLLPYIAHLETYSKLHRLPLIESEASKLMLRAINVCSIRLEI